MPAPPARVAGFRGVNAPSAEIWGQAKVARRPHLGEFRLGGQPVSEGARSCGSGGENPAPGGRDEELDGLSQLQAARPPQAQNFSRGRPASRGGCPRGPAGEPGWPVVTGDLARTCNLPRAPAAGDSPRPPRGSMRPA